MFKNYKVVITGATSGIGLATAKKFLDAGATVIGIGRNFDRTAELGDKFIPCKCDVSKPEEVENACKFIDETFGGELDTFVNAAGQGFGIDVKDVTAEIFDLGMHTLLLAPMLFGKNLYPLLLKAPQKNPSIVNISSAASKTIWSDNVIYNLAKNAYVLYSRQQAKGFIGVRCNSVCPGFIDTPIFMRPGTDLTEEQVAATFQVISQVVPSKRVGQPEEVADLIAFLASTNALYINGADVLIDGGYTTVAI